MDNIENIEWDERYNIGVSNIDKAHRRLFSIVKRLFDTVEKNQNKKHSCYEGIKYLSNYAITHFAEEEAYMRSIGYKGYERHKEKHDKMKNEIVPALEAELEEADYSGEAASRFLGVCLGWLTGHTMLEDRAITGEIGGKKIIDINNDINTEKPIIAGEKATKEEEEKVIDAVGEMISVIMKEMFKIDAKITDRHYDGEYFGKPAYYRAIYKNKKGRKIKILMIIEEKLILGTVGSVMNIRFNVVDNAVLSAAMQVSHHVMQSISQHSKLNSSKKDPFTLERESILSAKHFNEKFVASYFDFNILFDTEKGKFALCAKIL